MDLPPQVIKAFVALGDAQRGAPESAMLAVQHAMSGGVLNPVVENVGDLTHRMSHMIGWWPSAESATGHEYVANKVSSSLRYLTNKYGFEREMRENIVNNAKYVGKDAQRLKTSVYLALNRYADEHSKLPAYNQPQYLARETAVALGRGDFDKAVAYLKGLQALVKDPRAWGKAASDYRLDGDGRVVQYPWPRSMREASTKPFPPKKASSKDDIDEILRLLGRRPDR
jgi:hypothetical protein